ncbi:hypothetical protein PSYMO_33195 [Pseudomonas amygdali pv. mori str. 301020]|uniref:Uncharacterized protein n=1 Tax=Pseudomonas amygdali pv. mori str. 301020 TaxID=629261 RepID=A0A656GKF4_PSEA0|nr:hypothetical protein PSYMO_33195 [Pseudomonas amygdali pv. mori str. 301020]
MRKSFSEFPKGSVLESGRYMTIQASRDVTIVPTEVTNILFSG